MAAISRDRAKAGEDRTGPSDPLTQKPRDLLALVNRELELLQKLYLEKLRLIL